MKITRIETYDGEPFWDYISGGEWCDQDYYNNIMSLENAQISDLLKKTADNIQFVNCSKSDRHDSARLLILIAMRLFDRPVGYKPIDSEQLPNLLLPE